MRLVSSFGSLFFSFLCMRVMIAHSCSIDNSPFSMEEFKLAKIIIFICPDEYVEPHS